MITPALILAGIMYILAAIEYTQLGEYRLAIIFVLYAIVNFIYSTIRGAI